MVISDTNIATSFWSTLRSTLATAAPYTTHPNTSATTAASIKASYNDLDNARPMIVIDPINLPETFDKFGGSVGRKDINVVIRVFTEFSVGADQLDDQIRAALAADNMDGVSLQSIESSFDAPADPTLVKFHSKTISVHYLRE